MNLNCIGFINRANINLTKVNSSDPDNLLFDVGMAETIIEQNTCQDEKVPVYFDSENNAIVIGIPKTSNLIIQ